MVISWYGLPTPAGSDGVEPQAQRPFMRATCCHHGQGWKGDRSHDCRAELDRTIRRGVRHPPAALPGGMGEASPHRTRTRRQPWVDIVLCSAGATVPRARTVAPWLQSIATFHPMLIVWGRENRIIPVHCGAVSRQAIPGAVWQVIDRCGHVRQLERPEAGLKIVAAFLAASQAKVARGACAREEVR
jgi:pimeloyl-ACP methyl ester carboxylesterase